MKKITNNALSAIIELYEVFRIRENPEKTELEAWRRSHMERNI